MSDPFEAPKADDGSGPPPIRLTSDAVWYLSSIRLPLTLFAVLAVLCSGCGAFGSFFTALGALMQPNPLMIVSFSAYFVWLVGAGAMAWQLVRAVFPLWNGLTGPDPSAAVEQSFRYQFRFWIVLAVLIGMILALYGVLVVAIVAMGPGFAQQLTTMPPR